MRQQRIPAYAYIRVSTTGHLTGYGPERQEEMVRDFARRAGYEVVAVFIDAHSGTEADRPEFTKMLAEMMSNGVKTVIVESLDRLARDVTIQSILLAKLAAEHLTLVAANTGEDITAALEADPMRRALVQMQAVFAELDRRMTVQRLKKGRDAKRAATGRCEGPLPYGSDPERPLETTTLAHMKELKAQRPRLSLQTIADRLNSEPAKYPTRTGKPWSRITIWQTLQKQGDSQV
jgi:DNA invertase Pin-like site-specific DNA recombinase